jgi:hypothetical protein
MIVILGGGGGVAGLPDFFYTTFQNEGKYSKLPQHYQCPSNIPNDRKLFQMTIKYTSIFHSKAPRKLPKF